MRSSSLTSVMDYLCVELGDGDGDGGGGEKRSLGFMELLGLQDHIISSTSTSTSTSPSSSVFDVLQLLPSIHQLSSSSANTTQSSSSSSSSIHHHQQHQQPTTPNSSSISSQSSGATTTTTTTITAAAAAAPNHHIINNQHTKAAPPALDQDDDEDEDEDEDEHQHQQNTKKLLKPKKTNQKKQREPKFAFMTKSEVDHLEDGYRWRKYGQKAVKNSSFPRSYYRCTNAACNVKKRVERSFNDPGIVVTTYEGKHTHPSPLPLMHMPRATGLPPPASNFSGTYAMPMPRPMQMTTTSISSCLSHDHDHYHYQPHLNCGYLTSSHPTAISVHQRRFRAPTAAANLLRDHGLLQDILPSLVRKED